MQMNDEITAREVRLIDEEGEQAGIVPLTDALRRAKEEELDLVEISPSAEPPVCRIMDFGKFKYQQQKKLQDQKKKNHGVEIKQLRIKTFRIDPHDVEIKLKKARDFITEGHRLLFTLMFRARENSHAELGIKLLTEEFAEKLSDVAKIDSAPRKEGRKMTMMLSPLPNVAKAAAQREREKQAGSKKTKRDSVRTKAVKIDSPKEPENDYVSEYDNYEEE